MSLDKVNDKNKGISFRKLLLEEYPPIEEINHIPSMGTWKLSGYFYHITKNLSGNGCIVECGAWLGSCTAAMALGLADKKSTIPIHTFDYFKARGQDGEVLKAMNAGVELVDGQDTLKVVKKYIKPLYRNVVYHKGYIMDFKWDPKNKIVFYVDDMNKHPKSFIHALNTFGPAWIPGKTLIALMDFHIYKRPYHANRKTGIYQSKFIKKYKNHFKLIRDFEDKKNTAVIFKYIKKLDFSKVKYNKEDDYELTHGSKNKKEGLKRYMNKTE